MKIIHAARIAELQAPKPRKNPAAKPYKPAGLQRHKKVQAPSPGVTSVWQRCCKVPDDESFHRAAAEDMAAALLNAQGDNLVVTDSPPEIAMAPGRNLFGPGALSDSALAYYIELLAQSAFGKPSRIKAPSPNLAPYLLGGMTLGALEKLAARACRLIGIETEDTKTLFKSLVLVGFGEGSHHADLIPIHSLDRRPEETYEAYEARICKREGETIGEYADRMKVVIRDETGATGLNVRQRYLYLNARPGLTFAQCLLTKPPYEGSLRERVSKYKLKVVTSVNLLLQPESLEMPHAGFALVKGERSLMEYLEAIRVTDIGYSRAVTMVFDEPWKNLDLNGVLEHDVEVLLARQLILALIGNTTRPVYMSPATLVGISVLTGISLAKWAEFAVIDFQRRGETFITAQGLREALELCQFSDYGHLVNCEDEVTAAALMIEIQSGWAARLRKAKRPLWSTRNLDYYVRYVGHDRGEQVFKYKHPAEVVDR